MSERVPPPLLTFRPFCSPLRPRFPPSELPLYHTPPSPSLVCHSHSWGILGVPFPLRKLVKQCFAGSQPRLAQAKGLRRPSCPWGSCFLPPLSLPSFLSFQHRLAFLRRRRRPLGPFSLSLFSRSNLSTLYVKEGVDCCVSQSGRQAGRSLICIHIWRHFFSSSFCAATHCRSLRLESHQYSPRLQRLTGSSRHFQWYERPPSNLFRAKRILLCRQRNSGTTPRMLQAT